MKIEDIKKFNELNAEFIETCTKICQIFQKLHIPDSNFNNIGFCNKFELNLSEDTEESVVYCTGSYYFDSEEFPVECQFPVHLLTMNESEVISYGESIIKQLKEKENDVKESIITVDKDNMILKVNSKFTANLVLIHHLVTVDELTDFSGSININKWYPINGEDSIKIIKEQFPRTIDNEYINIKYV